MLKDLLNSFEEKYNNIKQEKDNLNALLETTATFQNLFPIPKLSSEPLEYRVTYITNKCPDINEEKAKLISKLIPVEETYLSVFYGKEVLTNQEYYLIPTNKYLWIINTKNYGAFYYNNLTCSMIKNNLMSKILLLNNILIEINGSDQKINDYINTINDSNYRRKKINKETAYLCGIIPKYQQINSIGSGISIDSSKTIVFHTKEKNTKCSTEDIENYEILLDNQVYQSKNSYSSKSIGTFSNSCYQINIRIIMKDNQILTLPILSQNAFGTKYNSHDNIFKHNLEFANSLIKKLNEISSKY